MTALSSPPDRVETELSAFVRGIEQRGLVLAQNQCASAARARAATMACKAQFHEQAVDTAPEEWPSLYWRVLLAQPALRAIIAHDPRNPFSLLDPGPRAALLLRLVAELDPLQGAQALDVSPEAYRHALFRATETLRAKGIDESWMRALRDRLQLDSRPTHAAAPDTGDDQTTDHHRAPPRWLRPALVGAACMLACAAIGSFFWLPAFLRHAGTESLREQRPAEVLPTTASLIASADFDLLADPKGQGMARDLDLYAWYAARANASASPGNPSAPLPETTLPETSAPDVDAEPSEGGNGP